MTPLRIIAVKTGAFEVARLEEALRKEGCEILLERVETPEMFLRALERQPWDLVLADYDLPQINAALALELLEQRGLFLPLIVVDEPIGEEAAVALAKDGMRDFVASKDIPRLAAVILRETTHARILPEARSVAAAQLAKRFSLPLAAARTDLWEWDLRSGRITWSNTTHPSLGLPLGVVVGTLEGLRSVIHPADRYALNQAGEIFSENPQSEGQSELELRILRPDNVTGWWHSTFSTLCDPDGRPLRILGVGRDITKRKQAEEALRLSEQKFEIVFRRSPAMMIISTLVGGRILDVNEAFTHNLGYMREEVVGRAEEEINIWAEGDFRRQVVDRLTKSATLEDVPANLWHKSGASLAGLCSFAAVQVGIHRCLLTTSLRLSETDLAGMS